MSGLKLFRITSKVCFVKKLLFSLFAAAFLSTNGYAEIWDCDSIYVARDGTGIFKYKPQDGTIVSTGATARTTATIALGPISATNPALRMYRWYALDSTPDLYYADSSSSSPSFIEMATYSNFRIGEQVSGGEVNQLTGEIYLTGPYTGSTGTSSSGSGSFAIGVYNATANSVTASRVYTPARAYAVASDMAIDAEGNAYVLVRAAATGDTGSSNWYLMRINIRDQDGNFYPTPWRGDIVSAVTGMSSSASANNIWGLTFFNGKLYFARSTGGIYVLNPLTGAATQALSASAVTTDLASCQVSPIIRGTIYNDTEGDGAISGTEAGIDGVTVQLYNSAGNLLSESVTADGGTYSFMIDESNNVDFYIRVKQPSINGIHAAQTWASGGTFSQRGSTNTVYNYCTDFSNDDNTGSTGDKTCYGKRADGKDSSNDGLAGANYYSRVHVTTSLAVSRANFAFSIASDRSDSMREEVLHNQVFKQSNRPNAPHVYLGSGVSTDIDSIRNSAANTDSYDDGVFVVLNNNREVSLHQRGFIPGIPYRFKAYVNGTATKAMLMTGHISEGSSSWVNGFIGSPLPADNSIIFASNVTGTAGTNTIYRARYSTSNVTSLTSNTTSSADDPWVLDGEVEDYQVYIVDRQVKLALKTVGTSGNSGDLTFTMTNIATAAPSSTSAVISTNAPNVITEEPSGKTHRIINANTPISITVDKPQTLGIMKNETNCWDYKPYGTGYVSLPLSFSSYQSGGKWYDNITIDGASIAADADIECVFTYGSAPVINVVADITGRAFSADNFNLSITDQNSSQLRASNVSTSANTNITVSAVLEADHNNSVSITMAPGSHGVLGRYNFVAICNNEAQSIVNGTLNISPTFGTTTNCFITIATPAIHSGNSEIAVIPNNNTAGNTSLVLVTLKDALGAVIPTGGDDIRIFINSAVTMQLTNGTSSIYSPTTANITAIDYNNGTYGANISSNISGSAILTFSVNGNVSGNSATALFHHDRYDPDHSNTTITIPYPNVGVLNNATAIVRVVDRFSNPVTNATIALYVLSTDTGGTPTLYNNTVKNNNNGYYEINLTSALQGNVTVSFSIDGTNVNTTKNATAKFSATDYNVTGNYTTIKVEPNVTNAGNTSLITVRLADNQNNSIDGQSITIFVNSTNSANAIITPTPATNLGDGIYTANITSNVSGDYTVTFRVNSDYSNKTAIVRFTPDDIDLETFSYIDASNIVPAGANSTIKVYLADKFNNSITNATVGVNVLANNSGNFVPPGSNNSISYTADPADPIGGYYTVLYSTATAHTVTFGFSANGVSAPSSNNDTTTFTSGSVNLTHENTTFAVTPHEVLAGEYVTLTLRLVDDNSNGLDGYPVTFTVSNRTYENGSVINGNDGSVIISSVTDHGNGTYTANATTNTAQNVTFDFTVDGVGSGSTFGKTDWAKFKAKKFKLDHVNTTITATPVTSVNTNSTIIVTLVDDNSNPVNNESVTITILSGNAGNNGTFTPASPTVSQDGTGNGKYIVQFTTPVAENVTFGFRVGSESNNSKNASTLFTSGSADNSTSSLTFLPDMDSVTVENNFTATAIIKDSSGNPVASKTVVFTVSGGALNAYSCLTAPDGTCSVVWTSTVTGNFTMNATIDGKHIKNSPASKLFTAGNANETTSTFILESGPKIVGQTFSMNATLRDKYNNAVPNQLVFYSLEPAIEGAGFGTVGTETDSMNQTTGSAAISHNTLWSNLVGTYKITVRYGSPTGPEITGSNQTATFVAANATALNSNLTVTGDGPVDSAGGYYTVRVYAKDSIGPNLVPGASFNITVSNGTLTTDVNNPGMGVKSAACTTNPQGYCQYYWVSPNEKGNFTITASFPNGTAISNSPQVREFISGTANASFSTLEILETGPKTANGTDRYTALITLRDNNSMPTTGSVLVSVSGGLLTGGVASDSYGVDPVSGQVTIYWTSTTTGNFTINATIGNALIQNGTQIREFTAGSVSISNSNFVITPLSSVTADNVSTYILTVNIKDVNNNNKPGSLIVFDTEEGYLNNGTISYKNSTCISGGDGNCSITWFSDRVGNFSAIARVEGMIIRQHYRDFVQGAANLTTSNLTVSPTGSRTADNSSYFTATAYIKDALNHDITGELVTFNVNSGWLDNGTNKGTTLTCVSLNGSCSVQWRSDTPGSPTIRAVIFAGDVGIEQRNFTATTATAANSSLEVTPPGPVTVGTGSYRATVTALDIGGVPAPGAIIQFTVSGGVLNTDSCEANASGQCFVTWTSNQSGNFSINATIASTNLGGNGDAVKASPQYRVFSPGTSTSANSSLVITPATNTVVANSGNYYTLNITARDTYNNPVPNQLVNIHIGYGELSNDTVLFIAGDSTCLTNGNGVCFVYWRSNKTGEFAVNATLGFSSPIYSSDEDKARRFAYGSISTSTSYFIVTSYNASQPNDIPVCEEDDSTIASCQIYYALNAFVEDSSGNDMEGANVTFRIYRDGEEVRDSYLDDKITDGFHGTIAGGHSCITNAQGRCSANITLKANIAGTYRIYAIVGSTNLNGYGVGGTSIDRRFVAAKASNATSRLHFSPVADNSVEADNVSSYIVTAEILDIHRNPISNASVALEVPLGISWLDNITTVNSSLTCVSAASGNCSVSWRSTYANDPQNITAQVQSITLGGSRTFVTGAPNFNTSNITVSAHEVTTNESVIVTVTVNDANGNPIKNTNHNVVIYTSLANSSFAGGTGDHTGTLLNVNGTYSAVLSSKNIGNTTLTFTINGGAASPNTEWVYFNSSTVCLQDCENSNATWIKAQSPVETGNNSLVTVYLGDTYGNPVDNLSITVYAFDNNTNSTVTLNGAENVTINGGTNGKYEANLTAYNKGNVSVSFIINNYSIDAKDYGKVAVVEFKTGNASANESLIYVTHEIDNNTIVSADGIDYYTVTVIARDAYGSVAADNISITFEVNKGNLSNITANSGDIQTLACSTDENGTCVVYWMSEEWGLGAVTAYINGEMVSGFPVEREFKRLIFDDNLTITDFAPSSKSAHIGDLIRYTVTIENNIDQNTTFSLNNLIPKGFSFIEGSIISSTANGTVNSTIVGASEFFAENLVIYGMGKLTVVYTLRVGAGVKKGTHKSYAESFKAGNSISNRASTEVEVTGDPMLDESLIFGTVYIDANANGVQDKGEAGIPGVRIMSAEGYVITTDQFGRYHLLNILGGEWGSGRNFILKVDESSLPKGSTFTTANPLLRRLTPGIPVRFDFGVKLSNDLKTLETLMQGGAQ